MPRIRTLLLSPDGAPLHVERERLGARDAVSARSARTAVVVRHVAGLPVSAYPVATPGRRVELQERSVSSR